MNTKFFRWMFFAVSSLFILTISIFIVYSASNQTRCTALNKSWCENKSAWANSKLTAQDYNDLVDYVEGLGTDILLLKNKVCPNWYFDSDWRCCKNTCGSYTYKTNFKWKRYKVGWNIETVNLNSEAELNEFINDPNNDVVNIQHLNYSFCAVDSDVNTKKIWIMGNTWIDLECAYRKDADNKDILAILSHDIDGSNMGLVMISNQERKAWTEESASCSSSNYNLSTNSCSNKCILKEICKQAY